MDGSRHLGLGHNSGSAAAAPAYDVERVRADFPILHRPVHGKRLAYLDSAGSAQKPRAVIDAEVRAYETAYSNVHRGASYLSGVATQAYEDARATVARFVNAREAREVVFTKNATEAINLVAFAWGRKALRPGDEILISEMEHHSNIVPWQLVAEQTGAVVKAVPIDGAGNFLLDEYERLLTPRTKMVAVTHVSNVLGTVVPIADVARLAHKVGAKVLIDGCQGIVHEPVDVQALDVDFYVCSAHKLYGPSAIGALWGRGALLDAMPPFQGGGGMIETVTIERTTFAPVPARFEAGTPAIAQAPAFAAALDYIGSTGFAAIEAHERALLDYGTALLQDIPGVMIHGQAREKTAVIAFTVGEVHAHDVATIVDKHGVAVRSGHHCTQPLHAKLGVAATCRASLGMYSTRADLDQLAAALRNVQEIFR
ncbi:MAG: SufS family cysteine desulfurase [Alphaproteobacteria bacterium]|nr:SufS family cysteine desulfurase [Alphaproteobacteria bacterium]